jgi:mRNA interferase MazF
MEFQRSDVLLVPFPFSDLSATKARPAVVISSSIYHAAEPDPILAAITSDVVTATSPMDYLLQDWLAAGLRYPSALKPVLFTLDPTRVIHRIGRLTIADQIEVDQWLRCALGL